MPTFKSVLADFILLTDELAREQCSTRPPCAHCILRFSWLLHEMKVTTCSSTTLERLSWTASHTCALRCVVSVHVSGTTDVVAECHATR